MLPSPILCWVLPDLGCWRGRYRVHAPRTMCRRVFIAVWDVTESSSPHEALPSLRRCHVRHRRIPMTVVGVFEHPYLCEALLGLGVRFTLKRLGCCLASGSYGSRTRPFPSLFLFCWLTRLWGGFVLISSVDPSHIIFCPLLISDIIATLDGKSCTPDRTHQTGRRISHRIGTRTQLLDRSQAPNSHLITVSAPSLQNSHRASSTDIIDT
jgi:hypothetical protein